MDYGLIILSGVLCGMVCLFGGYALGRMSLDFNAPKHSAHPGYIELRGDEYHAVKCTMRSPEDVARRAGV